LKLLKRSDSEQMGKLYNLLRQSPHVIDWFLETLVFPTYLRYQQACCCCGPHVGHLDSDSLKPWSPKASDALCSPLLSTP
jgi:hypothetical protein